LRFQVPANFVGAISAGLFFTSKKEVYHAKEKDQKANEEKSLRILLTSEICRNE